MTANTDAGRVAHTDGAVSYLAAPMRHALSESNALDRIRGTRPKAHRPSNRKSWKNHPQMAMERAPVSGYDQSPFH